MGRTNMLNNINKVLKIVMDDGREMTGKLLVYDHHMNVVLSNTTELRPQTRRMKAENITPTRSLGLILLRGEHVVSVTVLSGEKDKEGGEGGSARPANFDHAPKAKKAGVKRARVEEESEADDGADAKKA